MRTVSGRWFLLDVEKNDSSPAVLDIRQPAVLDIRECFGGWGLVVLNG